MLGVTVLGNNSANPAFGRHLTAQILNFRDEIFLIDCGEATQFQMIKYKIKRAKINKIFISHLHGDHYYGLIGLLTSMALLGRTEPLIIFGPKDIDTVILVQLKASDSRIPYQLIFKINETNGEIYNDGKIKISCFAVTHRIPTWGYKFEEIKFLRKVNAEACRQFEIPVAFYNHLKKGENYTQKNGNIISNELVTTSNTNGKSYAFCADTVYDELIIDEVRNVTLLYHETTYLKCDSERAKLYYHSTTIDAANIALKANVGKLLYGHFSGRYENLLPFESEIKEIFPNCIMATEGCSIII